MDLNREREGETKSPLNLRTFLQALAFHVAAFLVFFVASWILSRPPDVIIPIDMTVVVNENLDREPDDETPAPVPKPPTPKPPEPKPEKQIEEPPKVDDKLDALVKEKPKPKKKEFKKGKLVKQDPKKQKPAEKKEFKKGQLVKNVEPPQRTGNGPRTEKKLSEAEIARLLALGARPGTKNQIAPNETSRCVSLIAAAIQREWDRESFNWHRGLRPIQVTLRLGPGGSVRGYSIVRGSGDADVDRTANAALRRVRQVLGLTPEFLSNFPELTVEMTPLAR